MAERARKRAKYVESANGTNGTDDALAEYTAAEAMLATFVDAHVTHPFVNLGSVTLEAMSKRKHEDNEMAGSRKYGTCMTILKLVDTD